MQSLMKLTYTAEQKNLFYKTGEYKMKRNMKLVVFLCFFSLICCSISVKTTSKDINAAQKTTKAYKKYLGKWETVDYKMNVKVINKNYLKAVIKAKNGDTLTINQKLKVKKKNTLMLTSKKGIEVKVILQFKYGKPYKDYHHNTIVNGPNIFLAGMNKTWSNSTYYKETKNGKTVPVMLVYTKTLKKKK